MNNSENRKYIEKLFNLGHEAFNNNDYEKAISYLDEIIDIYNKDIIAYSDNEFIIYSGPYENNNEYEEERNIDEEEINSTHNTLVDAYYNRAISKYNLKNYEGAIEDLDKVIELSPEKINAYYNRGHSKSYLGRYEEGIKDFKKVLEFNEDDAEARYYVGLGYFYLENYEEAIENFDKILSLDNEIYDAYYYRGICKSNLELYNEAKEDYQKALECEPENIINIYNDFGLLEYKLGNYKNAINYYNKIIETDDSIYYVYYNKALAEEALELYDEALKDYDKSIELNPNDTYSYNTGVNTPSDYTNNKTVFTSVWVDNDYPITVKSGTEWTASGDLNQIFTTPDAAKTLLTYKLPNLDSYPELNGTYATGKGLQMSSNYLTGTPTLNQGDVFKEITLPVDVYVTTNRKSYKKTTNVKISSYDKKLLFNVSSI